MKCLIERFFACLPNQNRMQSKMFEVAEHRCAESVEEGLESWRIDEVLAESVAGQSTFSFDELTQTF